MATTIEKEWIAVNESDEVVERADTKNQLKKKIGTEKCPECGEFTKTEYEVFAVPKAHKSLFI